MAIYRNISNSFCYLKKCTFNDIFISENLKNTNNKYNQIINIIKSNLD